MITRVEIPASSEVTRVWLPAALIGETTFQKTLSNEFKAAGGTVQIVKMKSDSLGIAAARNFPLAWDLS